MSDTPRIETGDEPRVLLVEDNPADAALVRDLLRLTEGTVYHVTTVPRLAEARELLTTRSCEAVLLDLELPDSRDMETVQEVRRAAPNVPLVVLTGQDDPEVGLRSIRNGAQDFLPKDELSPGLLTRTLQYAMERKRVEDELRLMAVTFRTSQAILITDAAGRIERVNPAFTDITGYAAEEVIGHSPAKLQSGKHDATFYKAMWRALEHDDHWEGEIWNRRKNGEIYPEWESISAVRDDFGEIVHYVAVFHDISVQKRLEEELEREATTDRLTGAANRLRFEQTLEDALRRRRRYRHSTALIMFDLDHFKSVNDTHGHDAGDRVLQFVVERVGALIRETDLLARWGGEEFIVILPETDADGAFRLAERMRRQIAARPIPEVGTITASLGVTVATDDDDSNTLLKRLDQVLYRAKDEGRDRTLLIDPDETVHAAPPGDPGTV
ncbi:MAG: diguanylate cyclase [Pseudomonadota bacterium]